MIGEYGMTELSSQLYDASASGAFSSGAERRYVAPHWLQVRAVDPVTLERVARGERGLARFVDLGNVDSALAIVTEDLIREHDDGIELCGRAQGAEARGCSLAVEQLLLGS